MKKIIILITSFLLCFSVFAKPINNSISSLDFAKQMGFGWNLGNTLDATNGAGLGSETSWGQPLTSKEMIDALAKSGIKTIRIPVSWHNHITDTKKYTVDPAWMARVKTIVDWAIENDMYVILNTHHDNEVKHSGALTPGKGYYPLEKDKAESEKFLTAVWTQICKTFNNDYDEHLIFETLNEPRLMGHNHEWTYVKSCSECKEAMSVLKEFNQKIVDIIRSSGGNNATRFIGVPSLACGIDSLLAEDFVLPSDKAGRIMAAVHMYSPYPFAMDPNPSINKFTESHKRELDYNFDRIYKKFCQNGVAVYIGEMGATNKENLAAREAWFEYFVGKAMAKNMPAVLWDNGAFDASSKEYSEKYGFYCRTQYKWYFPTLIKKSIAAAGGKVGDVSEYDPSYEYGFKQDNAETLVSEFDTKCWNNSIIIPRSKLDLLKEGSIIKIVVKPSVSKDKNYKLLSFRDTYWKDLPAFTGITYGDGSLNGNGVSPNRDEGKLFWVLSKKDAEILKRQDVLLCGNNVNVSAIYVQY